MPLNLSLKVTKVIQIFWDGLVNDKIAHYIWIVAVLFRWDKIQLWIQAVKNGEVKKKKGWCLSFFFPLEM